MNPCKCGCGFLVKKNYKKGHGRRGKKNSVEHNLAISAKNKNRKLSKEHIEKVRKKTIGRKLTEKQKEHLSKKAKELGFGKWMKGKKLKKETIEKLKKRPRNQCKTSTKQKISAANRGKNNGMYGKNHSNEAKQKISLASKKLWETKRDKFMEIASSPERKLKLSLARQKQIFPKKDTAPEIKIENFLIKLKTEYKKHHLINIPSIYQADFYLPKENIVIEVDGIYWHKYPNLRDIDIKRNKEMSEIGITVIRLWEHEVEKLDSPEELYFILQTKSKGIVQDKPLPKKYERFRSKYGIF